MIIELYCNGELKKWWFHESEHNDTPGEAGFRARAKELKDRVDILKCSPSVLLMTGQCERWEFHFRIKSKGRAADFQDSETDLLTEQ